MIKVYQTLTVANDGVGNCFNACVASILEMRLCDTPAILPNTGGDWHEQWRLWFHDQGFNLTYTDPLMPPKGYSIGSVTTDRVFPDDHRKAGQKISHAVVYFNDVLVHDPFPIPSSVIELQYYQVLVPLTEAEQHLHAIRSEQGRCIHGYKHTCTVC